MIQREHEMDFGPEVQGDHGSEDLPSVTTQDLLTMIVNDVQGVLLVSVRSDFLDFVPTPS